MNQSDMKTQAASTMGDDYGDDSAHASLLTVASAISGTLETLDDKDAFKIKVEAGHIYGPRCGWRLTITMSLS
jgi:hypothetical protein